MRRIGKIIAPATALTLIAGGCASKPSVPEILSSETDCTPQAGTEESFAGTIAVSGALEADKAFNQHVLDVSRDIQTDMCKRVTEIGAALLKAYNAQDGEKNVRLINPAEMGTDAFRLVTTIPVSESTKQIQVDYWDDVKRTNDGPLDTAGIFGVTITDSRDGGTDTTDINPVGTPGGDAWDMVVYRREGNGEQRVIYEAVTTVTQESDLTDHTTKLADRLEQIDTVAEAIIPGYRDK